MKYSKFVGQLRLFFYPFPRRTAWTRNSEIWSKDIILIFQFGIAEKFIVIQPNS